MVLSPLRKTRICFVIDKLAQRSGGAERVLIDTANALHERGYAVDIVTHEPRGKAPFYALRKGITLANLRPRNEHRSRLRRGFDRLRSVMHRNRVFVPGFARLQWMSQHYGFRARIAAHIDATRPDVVCAFLPPAVTAVGWAHTKHKPRLFASLHNVPAQDFQNPARWDPNPVDRKLRKKSLARFDGIGTLLPEFVPWFDPHLRAKVMVLPNASRMQNTDVSSEAMREKVVVSVGRLADVKRHDLLIAAWAQIQHEFPDWRCHIYGVGPLEHTLKAQIADLGLEGKVQLRGHTQDIENVYATSAILAHPAKFEGFGLVVVEALAHGLPVVGFEDCTGLNHIVSHEQTGLFVPSDGDRIADFAAALSQLMMQPKTRDAMGAAGRVRAADFSAERVTDLWEHALQTSDSADQQRAPVKIGHAQWDV